MRTKLRPSPLFAALCGIGLASSAFAAPPSAPAPTAGSKPVAVVNGETVTAVELEAVLRLLPPLPSGAGEPERRQARREALELLLDDALMRQYLGAHGQPVDPRDVDRRLGELVAALKAQGRSLQDFLKDTAQSEAHLRQDIQKKVQWDALVKGQATDENLRRYYEQNRDFYDQVTVRASHILVRVPPGAPGGDWQTAARTLEGLRGRIVAGQVDFSEAARKFSQCSSAPSGGDIGYFPRKYAVDEAISRAAFATRVGEVTPVVQSEIGVHLIKVTDRRPGQPSDFARIRDKVAEDFAGELWQTILNQQRRQADIKLLEP